MILLCILRQALEHSICSCWILNARYLEHTFRLYTTICTVGTAAMMSVTVVRTGWNFTRDADIAEVLTKTLRIDSALRSIF